MHSHTTTGGRGRLQLARFVRKANEEVRRRLHRASNRGAMLDSGSGHGSNARPSRRRPVGRYVLQSSRRLTGSLERIFRAEDLVPPPSSGCLKTCGKRIRALHPEVKS
jgi:hypothetical protein